MTTQRYARQFGRHATAGFVLGRLVQFAILVLGLLIAATVAFPSFQMSDLVTTLGLTSVALGFAFRDILQNFLAGILILSSDPSATLMTKSNAFNFDSDRFPETRTSTTMTA